MKMSQIFARAVLVIGLSFAVQVGLGQQPGIRRTELQRHDLGIPGREAVQVRIDFDAGAAFPKHTHPGEEIIYVIEGTVTGYAEGRRCFVHSGRNDPFGQERRHRQRGRARHVCCRKGKAARDAGAISERFEKGGYKDDHLVNSIYFRN